MSEARILAVLDAASELKADGQPAEEGFRYRFSSAAECLRKHTYAAIAKKRGEDVVRVRKPVRWQAAAVAGTALGAWLEAAAKKLGADAQVKVVIHGTPGVDGHLDVLWPDEVWDIKWVGRFQWREAQKGPNPKHVMQVNGYAAATDKPKWALVYFPLESLAQGEDLPFVAWPGDTTPDGATVVQERWARVYDHASLGTLPEREHDSVDDFECRQCPFARECWPEYYEEGF